jgi:hypothetical protein
VRNTQKCTTYFSIIYMTAISLVHPEFTPGFLVGFVLLIFFVFCIVLLCILKFWVPCCDVHYNFRTMFESFLPPVVCRRACVLFTLFVFVYVKWCPTHKCVVFLFYFSSSFVSYVASFCGLSIFNCPFGIL